MKNLVSLLFSFVLMWTNSVQTSPAFQTTLNENSVRVSYPESIEFSLDLNSTSVIENVELVFGTDVISCGESLSRALPEDYEPSTHVQVQWEWVLRRSGSLPPGTKVWWEWHLTDSNGNKTIIPREEVIFIDVRDNWKKFSTAQVQIFYLEGDEAFASELAYAGETTLAFLEDSTGVKLNEPVRVYIYPDSETMQTATLFAPDWSGGMAFSEYRTVIAGVSPSQLAWGREVVAHELTHVVIGVYTFSCVSGLPTWLSEGLAMHAESSVGTNHSGEAARVQTAIDNNSLLTVGEISKLFSNDPELARLAYAQSLSLVDYLISQYGQQKMLNMLDAFKSGEQQDRVLNEVYAFSQTSLDAAWREWVGAEALAEAPEAEATATRTPFPTYAPIGAGVTSSPIPATNTPGPMQVDATPTQTPELPESRQPAGQLLIIVSASLLVLVLIIWALGSKRRGKNEI